MSIFQFLKLKNEKFLQYFLKKIFKEIKYFKNKKRIDITGIKSYNDLFRKYKNKIV